MSDLGRLAVVSIMVALSAWMVFIAIRAPFTGEIVNFFGRSNRTIHFTRDPIRFIGSVLGWLLIGPFVGAMGLMLVADVDRPLLALIPSHAGVIVAFIALLKAAPNDRSILDRLRLPEQTHEAYREAGPTAAVLEAVEEARRSERGRLRGRWLFALSAPIAPIVWLRYPPRSRDAWYLAVAGVLLAVGACLLHRRYARRIDALAAEALDKKTTAP